LLATHKRASADTAWADVATSVDEALALWRERRHMHVLADFGSLPCGSTGLQLARRIRSEDSEHAATLVFLLSSTVSPAQAAWARFSGAFAVVPRDRRSVAACLSGWTHHARTARRLDGSPLDGTMLAARQMIVSSLLSLRRLNPETLGSIETALATMGTADGHTAVDVSDMARAVAERMQHGKPRAALLSWLNQSAAVKDCAPQPKTCPTLPPTTRDGAGASAALRFAFVPSASHLPSTSLTPSTPDFPSFHGDTKRLLTAHESLRIGNQRS
jgi:CheY-like chemotaxis protein